MKSKSSVETDTQKIINKQTKKNEQKTNNYYSFWWNQRL